MPINFKLLIGALLFIIPVRSTQAGAADCPPDNYDLAALAALKATHFALEDAVGRQQLALDLVACLGEPDPRLRDGIAYEAYATWLGAAQLDKATRSALLSELLAALNAKAPDSAGFRQPFSALVLAELAGTDHVEAWLGAEQRDALVDSAVRYVASVRDYRGFDPVQGWRHGVAHGADLLMQLARNTALTKAQLDRILAAVASQVAPLGDHAYIDGESERLARPLLYVALRGLHSETEWQAWFQQITDPTPLPNWSQVFFSRNGLAKRHNLLGFLRAVYVGARESGEERLDVLLPSLRAAFKTVR